MRFPSHFPRFSATWLLVLPVSLFVGLMIASAGTALYPPVTRIAAPLVCSGGTLVYESHGASYRPGEHIVTRTIYCARGGAGPKSGAREDVTLSAAGASFLIYSAIAFILLRFALVPLLRRRAHAALEAMPGLRSVAGGLASFGEIFQRVEQEMERRDAFEPPDEEAGDDLAARLARLKALRDRGLITAADYEAKKAEILSRL
ncbi:MAG TPA: SHOCT domain-containing protein [Allosphingosinicella sp.]|nr:SHOCT domain-containing protein [Allosphingosinicella sp.]